MPNTLNPPTSRETLALGWLSAELAHRAGAWDGDAPEWFPAPPEFLTLWQEALDATVAHARSEQQYPYEDDDTTVLGPEVFAMRDGGLICWRGRHYILAPYDFAPDDDEQPDA